MTQTETDESLLNYISLKQHKTINKMFSINQSINQSVRHRHHAMLDDAAHDQRQFQVHPFRET